MTKPVWFPAILTFSSRWFFSIKINFWCTLYRNYFN